MPLFVLNINQDIFWNQDDFLKFLVENQGSPISIDTHQEGICLESAGIYKLLEIFNYKDVTISTSNVFEKHPVFKINARFFDEWFSDTKPVEEKYHTWDFSKIFGCFYNRPTWYRIGLSSFLYNNYKTQSLVNFRADPLRENQHNRFDLNNLLINSPTSMYNFVKMMPDLPLIVDRTESFAVGIKPDVYEDQLKTYYTKFLIEIVAETWTNGDTFAPTEKTSRPINFKKPFIIFGSKDYLCYLRQMGFRTFNDFWDESYDSYEGPERFARILSVIKSLATMSINDLESMYLSMNYTLDHNYELLKSRTYQRTFKHL